MAIYLYLVRLKGIFPHSSILFYALGNSSNYSSVFHLFSVGSPGIRPWNPPSRITCTYSGSAIAGCIRPQGAPKSVKNKQTPSPGLVNWRPASTSSRVSFPPSQPYRSPANDVVSHHNPWFPLRPLTPPPQPPPYKRYLFLGLSTFSRSLLVGRLTTIFNADRVRSSTIGDHRGTTCYRNRGPELPVVSSDL